MDARKLKLVFYAGGEPTRLRFWSLLSELATSGQLETAIPQYRFEFVRCSSQDEALTRLRRYARRPSPPALVLLSDALADSVFDITATESWTTSQWAKEVRDALGTCGVTIAIMDQPRRVTDIDRALGSRSTGQRLLETLKLATDKLCYMARPEKCGRTNPIEVRLIRRQHELLEYFQLRHRIYKIMGYLPDEIENTPSQMEIDWCDTIALHCGAYELRRDGRDTLVGAARVVIGSSVETHKNADLIARYRTWTLNLAAQDPILNSVMANRVLGLELPIFHSQDLGAVFQQCVLRNDVCGELSRVIVAEDYRGAGLSRRLVEFALHEGARAGVNHMFLECLEMHEELYRKFGFQRIEGAHAPVLAVNKTMIAMELCPLAVAKV